MVREVEEGLSLVLFSCNISLYENLEGKGALEFSLDC